MIIKEGSSQEYVHIDDIDYIKPQEKSPNIYDICYMVSETYTYLYLFILILLNIN